MNTESERRATLEDVIASAEVDGLKLKPAMRELVEHACLEGMDDAAFLCAVREWSCVP